MPWAKFIAEIQMVPFFFFFFPPKPWLADLDIPTSCFKMTLSKPVLFSTLNGASRT